MYTYLVVYESGITDIIKGSTLDNALFDIPSGRTGDIVAIIKV